MNYQYDFFFWSIQVVVTLPVCRLRARQPESPRTTRRRLAIEAGAPILTEARRLVHLVRVRVNTIHTTRSCGRESCASGRARTRTRKKKVKREKRKWIEKEEKKRKEKKRKVGNWWFTCAYTPSFKFFASGLGQ